MFFTLWCVGLGWTIVRISAFPTILPPGRPSNRADYRLSWPSDPTAVDYPVPDITDLSDCSCRSAFARDASARQSMLASNSGL